MEAYEADSEDSEKAYDQTTEAPFEKATQLPAALARHASYDGAFGPEKIRSPVKTLVEISGGGTRTDQ